MSLVRAIPEPLALGAILALAALVRLPGLATEELWLDEAWTVAVSSRPAATLVGSIVEENKPPLYSLAVHGWMALFGDGEAALRSLSAVFGLLTVALVHVAGRNLLDVRTGLIGALLSAVTPLAVYYSREARNYSMLAFLGLFAFVALERACRTGALRWWASYGVALFACIGTHFIAAPMLLVGACQVAVDGDARARRRWLLVTVVVTLALAPWALLMAGRLGQLFGGRSWLVPFWEGYPPPLAIPLSLRAFLPGGAVPSFVGLPTSARLQPLLLVGGAVLAVLAFWPRATRLLDPVPDRARILLAPYLFLPLLVPFLYSFRDPVYMVGRTDFLVFPAYCLVAAAGISRVRSAPFRAALVLACVGTAAAGLWVYRSSPSRTFERTPLQAVARATSAEDVIVVTDFARPTAEYYLRRFAPGRDLHFEPFPRDSESRAAVGGPASPDEAARLTGEAAALASRVDEALRRGRNVFVLYANTRTASYLARALAERFELPTLGSMPEYRLNQVGLRVQVATPRLKDRS